MTADLLVESGAVEALRLVASNDEHREAASFLLTRWEGVASVNSHVSPAEERVVSVKENRKRPSDSNEDSEKKKSKLEGDAPLPRLKLVIKRGSLSPRQSPESVQSVMQENALEESKPCDPATALEKLKSGLPGINRPSAAEKSSAPAIAKKKGFLMAKTMRMCGMKQTKKR